MEKKYQVKFVDMLYIDNKLIPVSIEHKKDKKYINFILNDVKLEVEKMYINQATYNKATQTIVMIKAGDGTVRYAEIGTLTSAICHYGKSVGYKYDKLSILRDGAFTNSKGVINIPADKIGKYFDTELSLKEIKDISKILQHGYNKDYICR